ncbi:MAG: hypothetical protein A2X13_13665 [Bacteroidetes bacterium GWC2_33_15]|nr:MAG: hypothetical protein A2X10_08880 [Bacteroidetes bacterium GWA2_33_15]OFX50395.1 MAG: hypothetical protein A2X13_13665 [Bacteroidetes bacterium GWC2_33_15]OFX66687.1 MAG: hypothetical protein A2X15_08210 [Bacteroidetes bacterium GWB2_32_14]HAN18621.1 hypothetical protein [Bacteroidales bacterium]
MKESLIYILKRILKENRIKVDEKELEFQLLSHPSYPSLHSVTGVLDHFAISNLALEVPKNIETLNQLPRFFLAYIKDINNDDLVLVTNKDSKICLIYNEKRTETLSTDKFLNAWTGVIVGVEKDNEVVPKTNPLDLTLFTSFLTIVLLIILFFSFKPDLFQSLHFLLSFAGLAISIVIVKHELGFHSKIADKFCSGNIDKINCDDVLKSKAANFFGVFKLSDVGIIYFLSLTVSWLLLSMNKAGYDSLIVISVLAIPFTFYSIIYQYFVVKKWCLLCLSVVLILWLQATSLFIVDIDITSLSFTYNSLLLVAFSFLLTTVFWQFVLPKMKKEKELSILKIEHYKFKRNYSIFNALISRYVQMNTAINGTNEIVFGDMNNLFKITIITNPLCSFCKGAHELVENLLKSGNKNIQITIRFNVNLNRDATDNKIALRLLELYNVSGIEQCLNAMHDIYGKLLPKNWLEKWGEAGNPQYIEILRAEKEWCKQNNINFTPEILINGRPLPKEYERNDLLYFVEDVVENEQQKIESSISELEYTS